MRKNQKANAIIINKINPGMKTALFENTITQFDNEGDTNNTAENYYTAITEYKGINQENYKSPGNVSLSAFREKLIGLRTALKDYELPVDADEGTQYGFEVKLRVQEEGNDQKVYYMAVGVYRKVESINGTLSLSADEYGRIKMLTDLKHEELEGLLAENISAMKVKYYYGMKDLIVDSDVDDRIWRFVGENEWRSTTYMILDLNKNLSINKGAYLTLNMPFANNIGWYEPMRKRIDGWRATSIGVLN